MVRSMTVLPASAPTPTLSCSCASGPMPLNSTMAPSGTAPSTGRTTLPTSPASDGMSRSSSEPSLIMFDAV